MKLSSFRHCMQVRVRTYDVDSQGIVHNINYLKYCETGRIEYRRNLGYHILPTGIFNDGLKVVVVRNAIDYSGFAYLDDLLNVYTKIAWIKSTSFCFHQMIERDSNKETICNCEGILVNLDNKNQPLRIGQGFRKEIESFELNLKTNHD